MKPKELGINSFSSWLLWAQSAKACGSNLTRECILAEAAKVKSWDGGGLHAPFTPGNAPPNRVSASSWSRPHRRAS